MADINKLKNKARREEQRENWARAIELYTRALEESRSEHAGAADLSLYNRIGDIHLRQGDKEKAVACYEEAIASYAADDLHTSAIALCNKVLRVLPTRVGIYRRLGQLHAATGLAADARLNYVRYVEAMEERGEAEEAMAALRECVDETRDPEAAVLLARRLEGTEPLDEDVRRLEVALEGAPGSGQAAELEGLLRKLRGASAGAADAAEEGGGDAPGGAEGAEPPERGREAEGERATEDPAPAAAVEPDPWAELGVEMDEQPWSAAAPDMGAEGSAAEAPVEEELAAEASAEEEPAAPAEAASPAGGTEVAPSPGPDVAPEADPDAATPKQPLVPRVAAELPERSRGPLRSWLPAPVGVELDPVEPVARTAGVARTGGAPAAAERVEPAVSGPPAERAVPLRAAAPEPLASSGPLTALVRVVRGSKREAQEGLATLATAPVGPRPAPEAAEGGVRGGSPARRREAAPAPEAGEAATRAPGRVPVGLRFPPEGREASARGEFDWMELLAGSKLRLPDRLADGRRDAGKPKKPDPAGPSESAPERITRRARRFFFGGGDGGAESNGGGGTRSAEPEPGPGTGRPGSPGGSVPYPCAPEPSIRPAEVVLLGSGDRLAAELREIGAVAEVGETIGSSPPEAGEVPSRPEPRRVSLVAPAPEAAEAAVGAAAAEALSAVHESIDELRAVVEERAAERTREQERAAERSREEERAADRAGEEGQVPSGGEVDGAAGRVDGRAARGPAGPMAGSAGPIAPELAEPPASGAPPQMRATESLRGAPAPPRSPGPVRTGTGTGAGGSSPRPGSTAGEGEGEADETFNQWVRSASADVLHASREELERRGETRKAFLVVERLLELEDDDPVLLRKRVEYATELRDGEALPRSYLALGRYLEADGDRREARATYAALLEHDPGNEAARTAQERLEDTPIDEEPRARPAGPAAGGSAEPGGVDGTPRREDVPGLRVEPGPTTGSASEGESMMVGTADAPSVRPYDEVQEDGPVDFEELLTDLRSQLVEDAPERDTRTRTELAAELKEMGLLDDAIRELQAAIREPDPPPEAFELLGEAFLEKGKPRIAARLLASALEAGDRGDREFLGVLYQLGVAYEQLREPGDALECYERIFSVNIDYRDIQARIQACST